MKAILLATIAGTLMTAATCYGQQTLDTWEGIKGNRRALERAEALSERQRIHDPNRKMEWYDKGIVQYQNGLITPDGQTIYTRIIQIIDANNALVDLHVNFGKHLAQQDKELIWAEIPTTGKVDGDRIDFTMEHVGTKQYDSVGGASKTIHLWRLASKERIDELKAKADAKANTDRKEAEAKAAAAAAERKAIDAALTRTWKDSGRPLIGKLLGVKEGYVQIETDKRTVKIPLTRLSQEDNDFIDKNLAAAEAQAKLPKSELEPKAAAPREWTDTKGKSISGMFGDNYSFS